MRVISISYFLNLELIKGIDSVPRDVLFIPCSPETVLKCHKRTRKSCFEEMEARGECVRNVYRKERKRNSVTKEKTLKMSPY